MIYQTYQAWLEAVFLKYPNAVIHDTVRKLRPEGTAVIIAVAFDGDEEVGNFDLGRGGKVE